MLGVLVGVGVEEAPVGDSTPRTRSPHRNYHSIFPKRGREGGGGEGNRGER